VVLLSISSLSKHRLHSVPCQDATLSNMAGPGTKGRGKHETQSTYLQIPEMLDAAVPLQLVQHRHAIGERARRRVAVDEEGARGEVFRALHRGWR